MTLCQELGLLQGSIVPSLSSLSFPCTGTTSLPVTWFGAGITVTHCTLNTSEVIEVPWLVQTLLGVGPPRSGGMPLTSTLRDQSWNTLVSS